MTSCCHSSFDSFACRLLKYAFIWLSFKALSGPIVLCINFLFGTGLVCTWHFFSSHQNQNTWPSNGCLTHFLTFLFIHAKQFFFVMFQVKNWLHATPKDVTEPRSSLATTVGRFIRGPLCTFWAVQELNQECQLLWTCTHCCFLLL